MPDQTDVDTESYYDSSGRLVHLGRDPNLYVVRYRPGVRSDDAQQISDSARRFLRDASENQSFVPQYNMQVYLNRTETRQAVRTNIAKLDEQAGVEFAAPVFRRAPAGDVIYGTNRFLVEFKDGVPQDEADERIAALNLKYGVKIIEQLAYARPRAGFLLEAPAGDGGSGPFALARRYYEESDGALLYAMPDLVQKRSFRDGSNLRATRGGAVTWTYEAEQWHLAACAVPEAWSANGHGSSDITVAISDNGVDVDHIEFAGKIGPQFDFASGIPDGRPKLESDMHGTACAGMAVAKGVNAYGSAPDCRLMAVRFPDMMGSADEARMFQWMADNSADVISCSWGPQDGTGITYPLPDNVRSAIRYCVANGRGGKGIPVFWAAGNGSESVSTDGYSCNPDVMAIGAVNERKEKAYYSDFGPEVFLTAPSSGLTTNGDRRVFTTDRSGPHGYNPGQADEGDVAGHYTNDFGGTSSCAPLVAGIAALMLSANRDLTAADVRAILMQTADKIGAGYDQNGHHPNFGYGLVNAGKAVVAAQTWVPGTGGSAANNRAVARIDGPSGVDRTASPPSFAIILPLGQFYAVEVASAPELLLAGTPAEQRDAARYYASWQDGGLLSAPTYTLPPTAWQALSGASRLYYRLWTSVSRTDWVNVKVTVADADIATAPFVPIGPAMDGPASIIVGPQTASRQSLPPLFDVVTVPAGTAYAVEFATAPELFDRNAHGAERNDANFYATWQDSMLLSSSSYRLPGAAWERLKSADRIAYRILTSASSTGWVSVKASTADAAFGAAPVVRIVA